MSAIIFSGAAQMLAIQLLAAGAPLAVIVLTCFVAGLRFLMYSAAMAPYLRPLPPRWQQALAFLLTDQAFATSVTPFRRRRRSARAARAFPRRRLRAVGVVAGRPTSSASSPAT